MFGVVVMFSGVTLFFMFMTVTHSGTPFDAGCTPVLNLNSR
jgi:hypothetical protein